MVLRELVERHAPPLERNPRHGPDEFRHDYYGRLEGFRKELAANDYELEKELPALEELVKGKFAHRFDNRTDHYEAFAAVVASILTDYLAKKAHDNPVKRKAVVESIERFMGGSFSVESRKSAASVLELNFGRDAGSVVSRMGVEAEKLGDFLKNHVNAVYAAKNKDPAAGTVAHHLTNQLSPYFYFCEAMKAHLKS